MLTLAFAQGAPAQAVTQPQPSIITSMMPIALIFIIFYFLLIRPQKKKQQEHAATLSKLAKNDEVVTSGGIYGTIVNVEKQNDIITLRIDDNTRIKIQKSAISGLRQKKTDSK